MPEPDNSTVEPESPAKAKWNLKRIIGLITIEPFIACWWLPAAMTFG